MTLKPVLNLSQYLVDIQLTYNENDLAFHEFFSYWSSDGIFKYCCCYIRSLLVCLQSFLN